MYKCRFFQSGGIGLTRLKQIILLLLLCTLIIPLAGCTMIEGNINALMKAPRPNAMQEQLASAIEGALGSNLKYITPSSGSIRNSLVMQDLNADGTDEAIIFYTVIDSNDVTSAANIAVFSEAEDGSWKMIKQINGQSSTVDYVEFWDFSGDGYSDLLIGWTKSETAKVLMAYDLHSQSEAVLFSDAYNESRLFFDENDELFIFTLSYDKASGTGTAKVMAVMDRALQTIASCPVDAHFETLSSIIYAKVSANKKAIILDARQGNNAVTQFLFYDRKSLTNPFYVSGVLSPLLIRETAFVCQDIDKDGIVEIPYTTSLPEMSSAASNANLSVMPITNWAELDMEALQTPYMDPLYYDFSSIVNNTLKYYYIIDSKWMGKITCYYNASDYSTTFYYVRQSDNSFTQMFSIYQLTEEEYDKRIEQGNWYELRKDESKIYAINIARDLSPEIKLLLGKVEDSRKGFMLLP